jgi:hypothetical protein
VDKNSLHGLGFLLPDPRSGRNDLVIDLSTIVAPENEQALGIRRPLLAEIPVDIMNAAVSFKFRTSNKSQEKVRK